MSPPAVPAALHPVVAAFLADRAAVCAALERFGSPLHLVFPQVFTDNLTALTEVLDRARCGSRICYAHKVNRSSAFVRTAARAGIGVDVASAAELRSALDAGFTPDRIEITGPKGLPLVRAAIAAQVTINVDNLWELARIADLADTAVPVLLRLSGFPGSAPSRFGIDLAAVGEAFDLLARHPDRLTLLGVAFHLDTASTQERVRAVGECLTVIERAYARGFTPSVLDIGGGLRQVFSADAAAYDAYDEALRAGLLGQGPALHWGTGTFGYHVAGGVTTGTPVFHKYANTESAADILAELLAAPLPGHGGRAVGAVLADNLLDLWLEPGKAVADRAGITVSQVEFVKRAGNGATLVHLDLSRDTVTAADQEVLIDPLVLSEPGESAPTGVFFAGRLCLERDLVTQRQVRVARMPAPGDPVVFPNTGAYHMDLSAANAAMHPTTPKVVVHQSDSGFLLCGDEEWR
ncbi:alanine racemase [Nocardia caishijiensis]|uniref:Diaminopimelate decarboxylase n=1 Tax=Nocardia caishijiensis TaxID=184756 RepID=A0ABQ6YLU2_9NOCA|nr:alanine racemase [Nocardia caishijiensis]KAF0846759.1 diaminopimelate decarboxylase [Nocardia caishijiensis]